MVAPLRRLGVNKPVPIEQVGSVDSILSSIGAFITGAHKWTSMLVDFSGIPSGARGFS